MGSGFCTHRQRRQLTIRSGAEFVAGDVNERDRIEPSDDAHHRHEDSTDSVYLLIFGQSSTGIV
jgi:hypothetical protein